MSATDKLRKASGSTRPVVTTLSLPKANGSTTAELTSATGWNTTTGVDVVMYRRQLNTTTGLYEKIDGTQTDWTAQLTGTTLSGMILQAGTEPASGYAADNNTVVFAGPTAQWSDDLIETLLTLFNQDQTLKSAPIRTALGISSNPTSDWNLLNAGVAPTSVTNNGNGSYDLVFATNDLTSVVSSGMRLRTTRTVAAPTQCTSLNGTTQFYSKSSPAGMTFTDDFVAGAWVKLSSYAGGAIISRYNGTSGWQLTINTSGQIDMRGFNAGAANTSVISSYQSIPLNKWVHIAAQLDMSTFTATTTTSYIMINGVDIPAVATRGGTNPTALVQAGDLQVGAANAGGFFSGKIAQAFVTSAKVTQANVRLLMSQGITSALVTAHSIVSAYSFDNSITDLNTTNANNLTANGSAVATNADSFAGTQASGLISSTLDYAIVQKPTYSTNTTLTVQVPEGCTIPTSGGVSTVYFASVGKPYGMPTQPNKYTISAVFRADQLYGISAINTWTIATNTKFNIPVGDWIPGYEGVFRSDSSASGTRSLFIALAKSGELTNGIFAYELTSRLVNTSSAFGIGDRSKRLHNPFTLTTATDYSIYGQIDVATGTETFSTVGSQGTVILYAENAYV